MTCLASESQTAIVGLDDDDDDDWSSAHMDVVDDLVGG